MYEYLTGRLVDAGPDEVVLDLAGVGWRLSVSGATASRLPAHGESVTLFTHHVVRDERPMLYGFASRDERALFEKLLTVSKIGPAIALALLSAMEPARLAATVDAGDVGLLSKVKGIGKRTAERLCVELKGRLDTVGPLPGAVTDRGASVSSALVALGYPRTAAAAAALAVAGSAPQDTPLEELVKQALARIGSAPTARGQSG